ncbi:MAG TPA: hypothetical protein VMS65_17645, partial [Polyangiaceae bacterium]|nr:hypothetical protein [Polyangiaceae bacterium]
MSGMVGKLGLLVLLVGSVACGTDRDRERLERNAGAAPVLSPQFELAASAQIPELSSELVFNDDPEYPSDAHLASVGGLGGPAFGNDSYLVTYLELTSHIAGVRFSRTGELLDPFGLFIATLPGVDFRAPSYPTPVVHTGTAWLTLWETPWTYPSDLNQIRCARLADDGTALDPDGVLVRDANTEHGPFQLAFDGTRVLAISERGTGFFLRPDCTLDSGPFVAFEEDHSQPP